MRLLAVTTLAILAPLYSAQDIGCFVPGECELGTLVKEGPRASVSACLEFCQETPTCNYFTHYSDIDACNLWSDCPALEESTCNDCVSGDVSCVGGQTCFVDGRCQAPVIDTLSAANADDCLAKCRADTECEWWSFDASDNFCFLFTMCSRVDMACPTCTHGQRSCRTKEVPSNTLFAIDFEFQYGGVELVDLTATADSPNNNCDHPAAFPENPVIGSEGVYLDGKPIVCGGFRIGDNVAIEACTVYNVAKDEWTPGYDMQQPRAFFASALYGPDGKEEWWLSGGAKNENQTAQITSELYTPGKGSRPFVNLPRYLAEHCKLRINETHYFLAGGIGDTDGAAWMFDSASEEFQPLAAMPGGRRNGGHCGLAVNGEGQREVVVAGGRKGLLPNYVATSEIYNLETGQWRVGTPLPFPLAFGSDVPYGETFLIAGGTKGFDSMDQIWKYDAIGDGFWEELPAKLDSPHSGDAAFLVPDDQFTCA